MRDRIEEALRSRPLAQAIRWIETAAGDRARVKSVRRLRGGDSSAVHAVTVECNGVAERLVLRRFVRSDWFAREPDIARREAAALRLLVRSDVPAPRLLAVDEDGSAAGVPSVLMTWLPGRIDLDPRDLDRWLARMAALLPQVHAIVPTAEELPWEYAPYTQPADVQVPAWTSRGNAWTALIEFADAPRPRAAESLIHRDYHSTNILWSRGCISGIVDWVNACRGPAGVDIGHCRRNLALLYGVAVADRFLEYWSELADYDPYWDALSLLDADLDAAVYSGWRDLGIDITTAATRARADEYVASLVARL